MVGEMVSKTNTAAKRQTAVKAWISDLTNGRYVKEEGEWEPNYILTKSDTKISRANIMGVLVSEVETFGGNHSFVLEDGTSKISVRSFDERPPKGITIGDAVTVVGRPRKFGEEIYILPEIVKKLDNTTWLEHRKLELEILYADRPEIAEPEEAKTDVADKSQHTTHDGSAHSPIADVEEERISDNPAGTSVEKPASPEKQDGAISQDEEMPTEEKPASETTEKNEAEENKSGKNPIDHVIDTIRGLDEGNGADTEDAIETSGIDREKAEMIINNLLMDGEVFEIKPGKLKVME